MRQHKLFEALPVLRIQHIRAFSLVRATHRLEPPGELFYSRMPLECDEYGTEVVSAKSGNNWRPPVVWTNETRPICGAGSLDSLTRAALPREFAGKDDGKSLRLRVSPNAQEEGMAGTLKAAVDKINALPAAPEFMLHTGDISHLSKPEEFDTVDQILKSAKPKDVFYVPGEHDVLNDDGKQFLERYGKGSKGAGWYSFDKKGVHFIGLINVMNLKAGGLGTLGHDQLEWLEDDVKHLTHSTPIVVFAHIPLWSVYPEWGWGTEDSTQALAYLKKFGSVTVLNGHIHQTMQKIEGNVTFHTAASTAFPQPQPGKADSPGPMKVPAEQLRSVLGITNVNYVQGQQALAVVDATLA